MLRTDRLCVWIVMFGFAMFFPSLTVLTFVDELCVLLFMGAALLDTIVNRAWRKYRLLWASIALIIGYCVYSILYVHFNTPTYIFIDGLLCLKPFIPFFVLNAVGSVFIDRDKLILRRIAIINCIIAVLFLLGGYSLIFNLGLHPMMFGIIILISMIVYIYCTTDGNTPLTKNQLIIVTAFLIAGLLCGRSKYYGEFILAMFLIYIYQPGMFKKISLKYMCIFSTLALAIIIVSYKKISYYFITGAGDTFDIETINSIARPMLYLVAGFLLVDYFPFGSGLASFASYPSQLNYSTLYYEYGLDKVYGLSPTYPDFIMDAYYPQLAQFGIVGVILFVTLFVYIYRRLLALMKLNPAQFKWNFIVGVLVICFVLIESVGGTEFVKSSGMLGMSLLGIITAKSQLETDNRPTDTAKSDSIDLKSKMIKI